MRIDITETEGVTTLVLSGALVDPGPVAELHLMIDQLLEAGRKKLSLDLRSLSVIDTVGMAEIFDATRRARKVGAEVLLITLTMIEGQVVTRVLKLDVHIESCETDEKGLAAVNGGRRKNDTNRD
ncbi:MAG: hypothetical protein A3B31_00345 [Candidatus Komeilibacteria bacterium RIFCSPLOWO2_01_FULL_53_11]|uniref:STAS domain-containing protein n=1 Tax=Candidatus Komeilibacteria bacterium RIFCSPLOWO2_01_FULL_53_11 TaxID=1798552 RepID=A0A1G2BV26_9BACT|nr:MAG: hypothetical protein A3B31_00345 [Candidatus Komeilibacteria bacterium RIFCSPLOWO2_01_FULL_53_11]